MSHGPVYHTIREQIADRIRTEVLTGALPEGAALREQELAQRFGVSRGPIRDALLQLTHEGLLVAKPNCGVRVGSGPSDDLQSLVVTLRRSIEEFALRHLISNPHPQTLADLAHIADQLQSACERGDMEAVVHHDMAFHRTLVGQVGEPALVAMWLPIVTRMMLRYTRHSELMAIYAEHAAILAAIHARDEPAALAALRENIQ